MEEHSLSAQLKRSGPTIQRRLRVLAYCLLSTKLAAATATTESSSPVPTQRQPPKRPADADDTAQGTRLALANVLQILRYSVESHASTSLRNHGSLDSTGPPRFLFAVGPKGVVLRSADRGMTWRGLHVSTAAEAAPLPPPEAGSSDDATLNEIIGLLPAAGDANEEGSDSGSDSEGESIAKSTEAVAASGAAASAPLKPAGPSDLHSVATLRDLVVVCGGDGFVAASADRGVQFLAMPRTHAACVKDRTKSKREFFTLQKVKFVGEGVTSTPGIVRQRLVLHTTHALLAGSFDWQPSTQKIVSFRPLELLHRFQHPIGCMEVTAERSSSQGEEPVFCVTVAVTNMLFLSFDKGRSLVPCPHRLGLLRDLVAVPYSVLPMVKPLLHPSVEGTIAALNSIGESEEAVVGRVGGGAAQQQQQQQQPRYLYDVSSAVSSSGPSSKNTILVSSNTAGGQTAEMTQALLAQWHDRFQRSQMFANQQSNEFVYRAWFVLATEGKVVPYDSTAILFVAVSRTLENSPTDSSSSSSPCTRLRMVTLPKHLDHLAFVQSGLVDRVGMDILLRRHYNFPKKEGESDLVWIRSTASGVSISSDCGLTWSTPQKSYTGTVVEMDESCVRVATQRRSVLHGSEFGLNLETVTMPTSLKLSNVLDLAVMR